MGNMVEGRASRPTSSIAAGRWRPALYQQILTDAADETSEDKAGREVRSWRE